MRSEEEESPVVPLLPLLVLGLLGRLGLEGGGGALAGAHEVGEQLRLLQQEVEPEQEIARN